MSDQTPPTDQTPPDQPPAATNAPPVIPSGYSYSGALAQAQKDLANRALQPVNPRQNQQGTYRFPGQADFSELMPNGGQPPPPPGFDTAQTDVTQLPNYDKLSAAERFVMSTLPGWAGQLKDQYAKWDSGWGGVPSKVLTPVGDIWQAGKNFLGFLGTTAIGKAGANLLSGLDVGAETVERGTGFAAQWINTWGDPTAGADFQHNLKSAWYAGTLAADAADVPSIFDPVSSILHVPQTLGGVSVLIKARQRISELVSQGVDYHQATITARDEWYSSLGALALRAQLHDVGFHLLADPVNIILPMLKPIEQLQMLRTTVTGLEATAAGLDELRAAEQTARAAALVAEGLGNAGKAAEHTAIADRIAQRIVDAGRTRLSWGEQVVTKILGAGDMEAGKANVVKLTGGAVGAPESLPGLRGIQEGKWNPFALTPEARVQEYMTILQDHVTSYAVAANTLPNGTVDVEGLVRAITRAKDGAFDPQMGNMILTLEGRSVRTTLAGFAGEAEGMLRDWRQTEFERNLLDQAARSLGVSPYEIIKRLDNGEGASVLDQLTKALGQDAEAGKNVARLLANANLKDLTPDVLERLHGILGDKAFVGYTDQLFVADLSNKLADFAAKQAIVQFGAKEQGFIRNLAEMTKQAESLAFLRLNPGYPIRNFVNNNITMIARGSFGTLTERAINDYWKALGFEPARLSEAITMEGRSAETALRAGQVLTPAQEALNRSASALRDVTEANRGWVGKITDAFKGLGNKLPDKLNASTYARDIERMASRRAFTVGYQRALPQFMRAAAGNILDHATELRGILPEGMAAEINRAVWSATRESDLEALKVSDNIKLNLRSVMDRTEARTGVKLDHVLSAEFQQSIETRVVEAMKSGDESKVSAVFRSIEQEVNRHIESAVDESLAIMRDETAAKVQAEGPAAYAKLWSDGRDEWWGAQEKHALDMATVGDAIRGKPPSEADALWRQLDKNSDDYYKRQWNRLEARMQGFADGAAKAGLPGSDAVMSDFRQLRSKWQSFFEKRTALKDEFFGAVNAGKTPRLTWAQVGEEMDGHYKNMIDAETRYQRRIDTTVARMLPPDQQAQFLAWRNRINDFRAADAQNVVAFRSRIAQIPPSLREEAYQAHWADRVKAWKQIKFEEDAGKAAMQGDKAAMLWYQPATQQTKMDLSAVDQLMQKKQAAFNAPDALAPEEQAILDQAWAQYATPDEMKQLNDIQQVANQDVTHPPMIPTPEGQQMIDEQTVAGEVAQQGQFFGGQNLDFGHVRTLEAADTGPGKRYQSFDFMSEGNGIHGRSPNSWSFDAGAGTVEPPSIWHDENQTAWSSKAPDIKGAKLYGGNNLLKGKDRTVIKATTIELADGTRWTKTKASNIPGWVDAFAESAGYDIGQGVTWDQIEKDLTSYLKGTSTDAVYGDLTKAADASAAKLDAAKAARDSLSAQSLSPAEKQALEMDVRKADKLAKKDRAAMMSARAERGAQMAPKIPMVVDQGTLDENKQMRAIQKAQIEQGIWERLQNGQTQQDQAAAQLAQPIHTTTPSGVSTNAQGAPLNPDGTPIDWRANAGRPPATPPAGVPAGAGQAPAALGITPLEYVKKLNPGMADAEAQAILDKSSPDELKALTETAAHQQPAGYAGPDRRQQLNRPPAGVNYPEAQAANDAAQQGLQQERANLGRRAGDTQPAVMTREKLIAKGFTPEQADQYIESQTRMLKGNPAAVGPVTQSATHIPDLNAMVPQEMYMGTGIDQLWFTRGQQTVRDLEQSALETMREKPLAFKDLPPEAQQGVNSFIAKAHGDLADARYGAIRMGEYHRDAALLNYSRRFNYNNWIGTIVPYEFWTTQSVQKWALHSLDRPAMLSGYLRLRKFMDTAYRPEAGFPTRLQGKLRIQLPFMPDWMGKDTFVDPFALALPFGGWSSPFSQYASQQTADVGAAERTLQGLFNDGKISQADMNDALKQHQGPTWDRAISLSQQDDSQSRQNAGDFASMLLPPHLPLLYAWDAAMHGKNPAQSYSDRGPVLPITRTIGGVLATLGANPAGPLNPEAALRKAMGLHPFGQFDDYYAERELTNMLAMGEVSVADARAAMVNHSGDVWDKAVQRSGVEKAGGNLISSALALSAVPTQGYPPGEEYLRKLAPEYQAAWAKYDAGDKKALDQFITDHPGYEERLALFKKPDERLHQFTSDAFWNQWNTLPTLTKTQLRDQMGADFNKMVGQTTDEIKSFRKNVPTDTMAAWLKVMGGNPPGSLTPSTSGGAQPADIKLASPELAQRAQTFYDMRSQQFPGWKAAQDAYFKLPQGQRINTGARDAALAQQYLSAREQQFGPDIAAKLAQYDSYAKGSNEQKAFGKANGIYNYFDFRKQFAAANPGFSNAIGYNDTIKQTSTTPQAQYLKAHPVLGAYWDWRRSFLTRNGDLLPYLTDEVKNAASKNPIVPQSKFQMSPQEWQQALGWSLYNLVLDAAHGDPLPKAVQGQLQSKASALGYPGNLEQLVNDAAGVPQ